VFFLLYFGLVSPVAVNPCLALRGFAFQWFAKFANQDLSFFFCWEKVRRNYSVLLLGVALTGITLVTLSFSSVGKEMSCDLK
jgi:hypothetical protein